MITRKGQKPNVSGFAVASEFFVVERFGYGYRSMEGRHDVAQKRSCRWHGGGWSDMSAAVVGAPWLFLRGILSAYLIDVTADRQP
jgi:hypothetical protein